MQSVFEPKDQEALRRLTQADMFASGVRVALSAWVPFGGIIGEFVTQLVPRRRLDRLQGFIEGLNERVGSLEDEFRARLVQSPAYSAPLEEACLAAVRSPSDRRRTELAEVLRTGLSHSDADLAGHHALLRLLDGLNDAQIIILMGYGSFGQTMVNPERDTFFEKHPGIFAVERPSYGDDDPKESAWALRNHYEDELIARGLLRDMEGFVKPQHKRLEITYLGRLLLEAIGQPIAP